MWTFSAYGQECAKCGIEIRYVSGSWANCQQHKHGIHEECGGSTHSPLNRTNLAMLKLDRFKAEGGPS